MLGAFVRGAVIGMLLLLAVGFFISNPSALWWVAGGVLLIVAIGFIVAIGDAIATRRAPPVQPALPFTGDSPAPNRTATASMPPALLAEHQRLRRNFTGWRYASPAALPRAAGPITGEPMSATIDSPDQESPDSGSAAKNTPDA